MQKNKPILTSLLYLIFLQAHAGAVPADLARLQTAYPEHIQSVTEAYLLWQDGSKMPMQAQPDAAPKTEAEKLLAPDLRDQVADVAYPAGKPQTPPQGDPGRVRYDPFFRKMYGASAAAVAQHLRKIYWMPGVFGKQYPLEVTTINGVDKKLEHISGALEKLPPAYYPFLKNPGGVFVWRTIAHTQRMSSHSFGIAMDINPHHSNYWQSDLKKAKQPISETAALIYHNQIPWKIVEIFEQQGFIWGGKWYHYDTMHFEYRPELLPVDN